MKQAKNNRIETDSVQLINIALGKVQVSISGTGLPVLVIHGSPGGVDAAKLMAGFLPVNQFRSISVSRPGYLRTPLGTNASIDHEVAQLVAVLDELGITRIAILAWSGGGPVAYRFAVNYPERVTSLVQLAALSSRWEKANYPLDSRFLFRSVLGNGLIRLFAHVALNRLIESALASEGAIRGLELKRFTADVLADETQRQFVLAITKTMSWAGRRRRGWNNDVTNYGQIDTLELEKVRCPVLLIHGDADTDVLPKYSRIAHDKLPNSQLILLKGGTHLAFYAHPESYAVQAKAKKLVSEVPVSCSFF